MLLTWRQVHERLELKKVDRNRDQRQDMREARLFYHPLKLVDHPLSLA